MSVITFLSFYLFPLNFLSYLFSFLFKFFPLFFRSFSLLFFLTLFHSFFFFLSYFLSYFNFFIFSFFLYFLLSFFNSHFFLFFNFLSFIRSIFPPFFAVSRLHFYSLFQYFFLFICTCSISFVLYHISFLLCIYFFFFFSLSFIRYSFICSSIFPLCFHFLAIPLWNRLCVLFSAFLAFVLLVQSKYYLKSFDSVCILSSRPCLNKRNIAFKFVPFICLSFIKTKLDHLSNLQKEIQSFDREMFSNLLSYLSLLIASNSTTAYNCQSHKVKFHKGLLFRRVGAVYVSPCSFIVHCVFDNQWLALSSDTFPALLARVIVTVQQFWLSFNKF